MKTRSKMLIVVIALVIIGAIWFVQDLKPEPQHHGKPLSFWIEQLVALPKGPEFDTAAEAVRTIGTNAFKRIRAGFRSQDGPWKRKLADVLSKKSGFRPLKRSDEKHLEAAWAAHVLGDKAERIIFDLGPALTNTAVLGGIAPDRNQALQDCLIIGVEAIPLLIRASQSSPGIEVLYNSTVLSIIRSDPFASTTKFIKLSTNGTDGIRTAAVLYLADALHELAGLESDDDFFKGRTPPSDEQRQEKYREALSALKNCLKDQNPIIRRNAALTLGRLGKGAKSCSFFLTDLLSDTNPSVRNAATNAMRNIDPTALKTAPNAVNPDL